MKSASEIIQDRGKEICKDLIDLLESHSNIERWNDNLANSIMILAGDYRFTKLSLSGEQLQRKIFEEFNVFFEILSSLMSKCPDKTKNQINELKKKVLLPIEQNTNLWDGDIDSFKSTAKDSFNGFSELLNGLYSHSNDDLIVLPDTNALLINPAIEKWNFDDTAKFEIVLCPTVLGELDDHKTNHRNESVREKAKVLINQFKEYRRRGALTKGVVIVKDKIALRSIAEEPNMQNALSWLDKENNDDRMIASFLEVMRNNPRSKAVLVTTDINLQNKLEAIGFPFAEPPE
jgi:rRNA-processing protein FCF1